MFEYFKKHSPPPPPWSKRLVDWIKNLWAYVLSWLRKFFGWWLPYVVGILLVYLTVTWPYEMLKGPKAYYVYIVGDFTNPSLARFLSAFENAQKQSLQIDKIRINVKSLNANEKQAADISTKLAKKNDTLLVIGHFSSTATAVALPKYLNADPPIPVILPLETNPELLPPDYRINYYPVFRLAPTDDRQAERAAEFLIKNRAQAIWVIEDVSENNLYSHYLVQELVRQIHAKGLHQEQSSQVASSSNVYKARNANAVHERVECSVTDTRSPARKSSNACAARRPNPNFQQSRDSECCVNENERSRVLLWTTNRELIPIDSLKAIDIDWIFLQARRQTA